MGLFSKKRDLHLIDLKKYEAMLARSREKGATIFPLIPPGDSMGKENYTADELAQIKDNYARMKEIWRRYSGK